METVKLKIGRTEFSIDKNDIVMDKNNRKGSEFIMELEISVKFVDECGLEVIKPVIVDTSVPNFDDFHNVNDFLPVFDQLERSGLKLRN